jgi:hypothetical protein
MIDECEAVGGMRIGRGNQSTTLSTTNTLTWLDLGWNPGRRGEKPAINLPELRHGPWNVSVLRDSTVRCNNGYRLVWQKSAILLANYIVMCYTAFPNAATRLNMFTCLRREWRYA